MVSASKQFAEVSTNEHADIAHLDSKITWLKIVVAGSFLIELVMSWRLWIGPRTFPKIPLLDIFPETSFYVDVSIFAVILCLLVVIMFHPRPRGFIYTFLVIIAFLAIDDQMRWQPYFYQYYFMVAALGAFAWSRGADKGLKGQQLALTTCRWIVASFYFYAGLQKANVRFISDVFPWFVKPIADVFPNAQAFLVAGSFLVPFLEMVLGVGLLVKSYRASAIVLACAIHVFILLMLGPLGHNWGTIVWPWNVTMIVLVFVLFWRTEQLPATPLRMRDHLIQKSILAPFVIMPFLSFFNLWDSKLSATMYSGTGNTAQIFISATVQKRLPNGVQAYVNYLDEKILVDYFSWSLYELGDTPPPETRIFKSIARHLCTYASQPSDVTLVVQGKPTWFRADKAATYTCASLGRQTH